MMWHMAITSLALAQTDNNSTGCDAVSRRLNDQIKRGEDTSCTYCGGKGVLVRSPLDGFEHDETKVVVPGTFWTNDLFTPTSLYPANGASANPLCPDSTGLVSCYTDPNTGESAPWNYAQLAVVIGSAMGELFPDFDNIQSKDWGWGVFYPTDSNAVDKRGRWQEENKGYDCPGGWVDGLTGEWADDPEMLGAGRYSFGNPYADGGGGGAGCHCEGKIDQTSAYTEGGQNLFQDSHCQCNYIFDQNWDDWTSAWLGAWHGPMYSLDYASCWTNNPRDMIGLQNSIWWMRNWWADGSTPEAQYGSGVDQTPGSNDGDRRYWGWNEVPVAHDVVDDPKNWDAVLIKLPTSMSGYGKQDSLSMLDTGHGLALEDALNTYVFSAGLLKPGLENVQSRPGSYVVLVREFADESGNFNRQFFCESWTSPTKKYNIVYDGSNDCCYIEFGGGVQAEQV